MDRQIVQVGALPLDTDTLNTNRYAMVGLGMALKALLGTTTCVDGLACTPNSPAALNVLIGAGSIYQYAAIDATAYGTLPADTADEIVQQGILFGETTLATPAPGTAGQSINYLIEAQFQQVDQTPVALLYYNAANPTQPLTGAATDTKRAGVCALQVKAGTAATTGTQTTPAPDAGWVGLWVVTVAYGQTTVTSGNISLYPAAPFITGRLGPGGFQVNAGNPNGALAGTAGTVGGQFPSLCWDITNNILWVCTTTGTSSSAVWTEIGDNTPWPFWCGTSTGSANAQTVTPPSAMQAFPAGTGVSFTAGYTNTGALSVTVGSFGTIPVRKDGPTGPVALTGGEVVAGNIVSARYDGTFLHLTATELGTAALKNQGQTVADPGTGSLEVASPISTQTGAAYTYQASDRGKTVLRSNSGAAMSDLLPASAPPNGWWVEIKNTDGSATLNIAAPGALSLDGAVDGQVALSLDQTCTITSDGSNYWVSAQPTLTTAQNAAPASALAFQIGQIL